MFAVSVVLCTHNPHADYLRRVLEALDQQTLSKSQWELLLVDNASQEPLSAVWDLSWHPNARHVLESEIGLASARWRGIREAAADLLVFVDDDNVLDPRYLAEAIRIGTEWPRLGVWGSGATSLEFEREPPEHLTPCFTMLAMRDSKVPRWSNVSTCIDATPWGAGLCIRASVASTYCEQLQQSIIQISGRRGKFLLSGDDNEIGYTACSVGFGMGIFPELKLVHLIPKERSTEEYFIKLREGIIFSNALLNYKWRGRIPVDPLSVLGGLTAFKNILLHHGFQRRLCLAEIRAMLKARRVIETMQSGNSTAAM